MAEIQAKIHSVGVEATEEVHKVFDKFDANGDGMISSKELVQVMKALGSETSQAEIHHVMEEIDTDKDGFISLQEFAAFYKAGAGGDGDAAELQEAFQMYDQDKDGKISAQELHQILSQLGENCTVQDTTKMIQSVDSDGDGFVNFEEFKMMMSNNKAAAAAADAN